MSRCIVSACACALVVAWSNWNGEQTCAPAAVRNVTTEDDCAAALADARAANARVRVVGAGHSFSPIDLTSGYILSLVPPATDAVQLVAPDTVQVHAGVHLYELNAALDGMGLALPNLGAIANQTVAGATQTNTHGTGPTGGTATFISGMRVVLANGTALTLSRAENPELFAAARAGYGAFGVVIAVNVTVWPAWAMEQVSAPFDLDDLLQRLPTLLTQYERLQWYWTPYTTNATLLVRANVSASTPMTGCWGNGTGFYSNPVTPPPVGMSAWPTGTKACTDTSYKTLTHDGDDSFLYTEMEMMVPTEGHLDLMKQFIAIQNTVQPQHDASVGLFTGVRYVLADDILLSPFYGRDTAVVSMIIIGNATYGGDQREVALYDQGLENLAFSQFSARPHPGKVNWFNYTMMEAAYPDTFAAFVALVQSVDPTGMFVNDYTARLFGF